MNHIGFSYGTIQLSFYRGGGVKIFPSLPTDCCSKKTEGSKIVKICQRRKWMVPISTIQLEQVPTHFKIDTTALPTCQVPSHAASGVSNMWLREHLLLAKQVVWVLQSKISGQKINTIWKPKYFANPSTALH